MEHKLDDFFRKKMGSIEDTLPENSTFNEHLFWGELQKNRDKPAAKGWWKWIALAACVGGLALWVVSVSTITPEVLKTSHIEKVEAPKEKSSPVTIIVPQKTKSKTPKPKKKEDIKPKKELKIEVEQLAVKINPVPTQTPTIKQDSIHFKPAPATMAEVKPQFKTIHVNEISNTEKSPVPQPKFKIRFAARNQH
jgi:hypothetical protein